MTLVLGHRVGKELYDFPHECPGDGCAVQRWLTYRHGAREMWLKERREETSERDEKCSEFVVE